MLQWPVPMAATGMLGHAVKQLVEATWRCCSGCVLMAVIGVLPHAMQQLVEVTWRCCSGRVAMVVIGVLLHAVQQLVEATWRCCSGHVITAVPNDDHTLLILEVRIDSHFLRPHAIDLSRRPFIDLELRQ